MREILFRGKRLCDGKWEEGNLCVDDKGEKHEILLRHLNYRISWEVIPETVGQYTGLKDKYGKRIFEGDILDHYAQSDIIVNRGVVFWDEKNARWAHQLRSMNPCFYMYKSEAFEVIGNIHDNPELMEVRDA